MHCVNELYCIFIIKNKETNKEKIKRQIFHFGPTRGIKNEVTMEKLLQGATPFALKF